MFFGSVICYVIRDVLVSLDAVPISYSRVVYLCSPMHASCCHVSHPPSPPQNHPNCRYLASFVNESRGLLEQTLYPLLVKEVYIPYIPSLTP